MGIKSCFEKNPRRQHWLAAGFDYLLYAIIG
jgi:hypothetical protein